MNRVEDTRLVAFGGGTGLPVLLRGLRDRVGDLTAVVTVADDGGSSGRLRQELGVAPPGDVRNCLVALAGRRRLAEVFQYRFQAPGDLNDHSVGNIIIAALSDMAGGFCEGVEQAARFLRIKGRVFPAATESLTLVVRYADGTVARGESVVHEVGKQVSQVSVEPVGIPAPPGVIESIEAADMIVLAPGSLFTSTIPALLGGGVREALADFAGPILYVANVMTQQGETGDFSVSDHVRAITEHVGSVVTDVLVHSGDLPPDTLARYEAEDAAPVSEVRRQLAASAASGARGVGRSELAGLVDACGVWNEEGVTLRTPSAAVARSVVRLWRSEFGMESRLSPIEPDRFGRTRYAVRTAGNGAIQAREELKFARTARTPAERAGYLRGAFQGAGSVNRPGGRGGHHLEFVHRESEFIRRCADFSRAPLKIVRRRRRWIAYTKSADGVTTVLAQMGLNDAVLEYEARAVLGEAKANANRVTNFDAANAGRTATAAARQQKAFQAIDPEHLSPALREMLELRLEYPDASLAELAYLGGLSKSAANHRLRRLVEIAR
ncbi:MAG: hypothetical protein K0Q96_2052 [Rubrobacteraceae bacterium]|nr:hypothetical protein [Rubrobacteraceae bacterium]